MAPKRGGSSSGSSGSSGSSSSSSYSTNLWLTETSLDGSMFTDGYSIAIFVFAGLFFVHLFGIGIWASSVKRKHRNNEVKKAVLGWKWVLAIAFALIYWAWQFIAGILYEAQATVAALYVVVLAILNATSYLADVFLLLTVFTLVHQCFIHPGGPNDQTRKSKGTILTVHTILCFVLLILYLAIFGLDISSVVKSVEGYGTYYARLDLITSKKIAIAFRTLFLIAALEIQVASMWLVVTSRKRELPRKVGIYLFAFIGFPIFIDTIFRLSFTVATRLPRWEKYLTIEAILADYIIEGICLVLIYAGVVLVSQQLARASLTPWDAAQHNNQVPPMQQGAPIPYPQQQYVAPQYGSAPPHQPYYPPASQQQYPPPQQNGVPNQGFYDPKPYNVAAPQTHEIPATNNR